MARVATEWRRSESEHRRLIAESVNSTDDGRSSAAGSFTLDASTTSTIVADTRVGVDSVITWMPKTSTAAAAMTSLYVSSRGNQTFTLMHNSTIDTDRDFEFHIGGTGRT